MTPAQIIHARRVRVLDRAAELDNVSAACREAGVSRKSYYQWLDKATRYGLAALMPKDRRPPVMPNAMSETEIAAIVAVAVANPTLGARQLVDLLVDHDVHRSPSGVAQVLGRHGLGTRRQRIAALARLTAAEAGTLTPAATDRPYGFCLAAVTPGQQVCLDTFYVGRLKGVGAVWQFTAVDVATRWAIARLVVGEKGARTAAAFLTHVQAALADLDVPLEHVLTDNGPEFTGHAFRDHAQALGIGHLRIPPRSPNHNAVCERFQGTALQEFYRRFFRRVRVDHVDDLEAALQRWLHRYNTRRRNRSDYMQGHTPLQQLTQLRDRIPA